MLIAGCCCLLKASFVGTTRFDNYSQRIDNQCIKSTKQPKLKD